MNAILLLILSFCAAACAFSTSSADFPYQRLLQSSLIGNNNFFNISFSDITKSGQFSLHYLNDANILLDSSSILLGPNMTYHLSASAIAQVQLISYASSFEVVLFLYFVAFPEDDQINYTGEYNIINLSNKFIRTKSRTSSIDDLIKKDAALRLSMQRQNKLDNNFNYQSLWTLHLIGDSIYNNSTPLFDIAIFSMQSTQLLIHRWMSISLKYTCNNDTALSYAIHTWEIGFMGGNPKSVMSVQSDSQCLDEAQLLYIASQKNYNSDIYLGELNDSNTNYDFSGLYFRIAYFAISNSNQIRTSILSLNNMNSILRENDPIKALYLAQSDTSLELNYSQILPHSCIVENCILCSSNSSLECIACKKGFYLNKIPENSNYYFGVLDQCSKSCEGESNLESKPPLYSLKCGKKNLIYICFI